jgi:predicted secreted protein
MNKGATIDGKLVRFKRRERTKGSVVSKKVSKDKAQSKPKQAKVVKINTAKTEKARKEGKAPETVKPAEPSEAAELPQPATTS